jgi:hypothetical protein
MVRYEGARYEGKPLLRLLEFYVLWAIDELPQASSESLEAMTPNFREIWKCEGTWQDCIATAMAFPRDMPELIRERWSHNSSLAASNREVLDPHDFAMMFVDANFDAPDA